MRNYFDMQEELAKTPGFIRECILCMTTKEAIIYIGKAISLCAIACTSISSPADDEGIKKLSSMVHADRPILNIL